MFHNLKLIFKNKANERKEKRYQQMGVTVSMGVNDPKHTRDSKEMTDMFFEWIDINNERILERILYYAWSLIEKKDCDSFNVEIAYHLLWKLVEIVIFDQGVNCPLLVDNLLVCIQKIRFKYPMEGRPLLFKLVDVVNTANHPYILQILTLFFEDFLITLGPEHVLSPEVFLRIQNMLLSEQDMRKQCANFFLEKCLNEFGDNPNEEHCKMINAALSCSAQDLSAYIKVLRCLNMEQSPQTLRALGSKLSQLRERNADPNWFTWLRIPYLILLQKSTQRRCIVEFFLENFTASELSRCNLLTEFLSFTNNTDLHNFEDYFIPFQQMELFTAEIENDLFLQAFNKVFWKGFPVDRWIDCLKPESRPQISKSQLFGLGQHVRNIESTALRNCTQLHVCKIFKVRVHRIIFYYSWLN